jgi:hypothetical protein
MPIHLMDPIGLSQSLYEFQSSSSLALRSTSPDPYTSTVSQISSRPTAARAPLVRVSTRPPS